jgi:hypothetical protein
MTTPDTNEPLNHERRRYPRYYVQARLTLAIEDESQNESIGLGEPGDISLGGLRVRNLPGCSNVRVGDKLGLLLLDPDVAGGTSTRARRLVFGVLDDGTPFAWEISAGAAGAVE